MDNRLTSLMQYSQVLTCAEYRVLAFIVEHSTLIGKITVRGLAQKTYLSTATIMRLCRKIGFSGSANAFITAKRC